jgi:hypothetical protein
MVDNDIPSWKHTGCGGQVYFDRENGFFCRCCENELSIPLEKVPRKLLRGTPFEAKVNREKQRKEETREVLKDVASIIAGIILR